eukprot:400341-Prorocentrum_minimum.AAC.1
MATVSFSACDFCVAAYTRALGTQTSVLWRPPLPSTPHPNATGAAAPKSSFQVRAACPYRHTLLYRHPHPNNNLNVTPSRTRRTRITPPADRPEGVTSRSEGGAKGAWRGSEGGPKAAPPANGAVREHFVGSSMRTTVRFTLTLACRLRAKPLPGTRGPKSDS